MKMAFREKEDKKMKLSKYVEKQIGFKRYEPDKVKARVEYIIDIIGDVEVEEDIYMLFIGMFQCFGGRYDVRVEEDTIKGMYEIISKYPFLTSDAIDEIWFLYIKDLFDEYSLPDMLEDFIKKYGKKEKTFDLYIKFIEACSDEHQKKYKEDVKKLEGLKGYSEKFIKHLKFLIESRHYKFDEILECLPSSELIKKDEEHISEISRQTRIFFGCCEPVSYTMFEILYERKSLDTYTETPTYYISTGHKVPATFTKTEFLKSIKEKKYLKKED